MFGGKLTALRYPELEIVQVLSKEMYAEPARPFLTAGQLTPQQEQDEVLDYEDVAGKRLIETRLFGNVTLREENAMAALEAMSRFAADPRWLVYLPPTMSPSETSKHPELLEHPQEAFAYYLANGAGRVVCEEKHMGSRSVVMVCRDEDAARRRFGVTSGEIGAIVTRTGRKFFDDPVRERELLTRVSEAMAKSGLWESLHSDWAVLDCELMPWSAKAQELLRKQYAPVGSSGTAALEAAAEVLRKAVGRMPEEADLQGMLERLDERQGCLGKYVDAYRRYCWKVDSLSDLKLAPFHLLASEACVHVDQDHVWHMEALGKMCEEDEVLMQTAYRVVDLEDDASQEEAIAWWTELTEKGGEGMVVKPYEFYFRGPKGAVQPAVKCRGREYLRIIYGPEYTLPANLERLRSRRLGTKRSLAMREFALGIEALERFVRHEPMRRVHECVFAVLAMETEPVDPRL